MMVIPVVTKKVLFDDATRFLKLDANFEGVKLKAEQGNAQAQYNLGFLYEYGFGLPEGVVKDQKEAVKWHRLAAEQGNKHAQYHLGSKYRDGEGVIKDMVYAHMWYNLAASNGSEMAEALRCLVEEKMTLSQIEEAQALAREFEENQRLVSGTSIH
jgi:TPR repeat protein|tara:strand:+ start:421 stop:888 length:468 start_codon:yes stop_codon:yes gene_type:complete